MSLQPNLADDAQVKYSLKEIGKMNKKYLRKITGKNEFFVLLTVIVLVIIVSLINPSFASTASAVNIIRAAIEPAIFAVGTYVVIVSGGIDVSSAAIGMFSMFTATKILYTSNFEGGVWLAYLLAVCFGVVWGFINGVLVSKVKIPPLIATLATSGIANGTMLFFIGAREISDVPQGIYNAGYSYLFTVENEHGFTYPLPTTFLVIVGVLIVTFILMRYTLLGRNIFAIGGDVVSASRSGINVTRTQIFAYAYAGLISGLGGMVHTIMMVNSNPVDLTGNEMLTIAAVVIGGARITGGHGSLTGTMLGVLLVTVLSNSLILVGIPSFWQRFVTGMVIIIGTSITSYQALRAKKKLHVEIETAEVQNG